MNNTPSFESVEERIQLSLELMDEGDLEEALEISRQLLAEDDQNFELWCLEGKIRQLLDEEQAAERAFERACTLAPNMAEPLLHKAGFLLETERYEETIATLKQALQYTDDKIDERDAYYLWADAEIKIAQDTYTQQIEETIGDEDLDPEHIPMPGHIREQFEHGLELTQKAIRLDPALPELWHLRASALMDLRQVEEAIDCYEEAIRQEPDNPTFLHDLGLACEVDERFEDAQSHYRKLYELETGDDVEGMDFSRAEFAEMVREAWHGLESDLMEMLEEPLPPFEVNTEDFPGEDLLEEAPTDSPFNPWVPLRLEITQKSEDDLQIRCTFYQRNIEREITSDDPLEVERYLRYLLENVLFNLHGFEEEEELEA